MNRTLALSLLAILSACASHASMGFATPEDAAGQLVAAIRADDVARLEAMLGPDARDLIHSGDDVADRNGRAKFVAEYDTKHSLEAGPDGARILYVGESEWPLPIPLVRAGNEWRWDVAAGREEMLNRRIGRNELNAIQVCLAICDAQRDYAGRDRDDDGIIEYAQRFRATPGTQDGLFWPAAEGEAASPLGELAAVAARENYRMAEGDEDPRPYHGYFYRMLTAQGRHAPGGAYGYMAGDNMIGGFAVVAFPAVYGVSGIMSFTVGHDGTVMQKDLGEQTGKLALAMKLFDPDPSWEPVQE